LIGSNIVVLIHKHLTERMNSITAESRFLPSVVIEREVYRCTTTAGTPCKA
jgi:hypothetical protein